MKGRYEKLLPIVLFMLIGTHASAAQVSVANNGAWYSMTVPGFDREPGPVASLLDVGGRPEGTEHRTFQVAPDNVKERLAATEGDLSIVLGLTRTASGLPDVRSLTMRSDHDIRDGVDNAFSDKFAVPIPAAAWLFGSALMGLTIVSRRRDRKQQVAENATA